MCLLLKFIILSKVELLAKFNFLKWCAEFRRGKGVCEIKAH